MQIALGRNVQSKLINIRSRSLDFKLTLQFVCKKFVIANAAFTAEPSRIENLQVIGSDNGAVVSQQRVTAQLNGKCSTADELTDLGNQ
jgi:hypothetical protein